jgi:cytochrome c
MLGLASSHLGQAEESENWVLARTAFVSQSQYEAEWRGHMTRCASYRLFCLGFAFVSPEAVAQDKADDPGQLTFNSACRTCHTIREGDNRLAPNLYGILGRKSGTTKNYYGYSASMQNADIVWGEKNLEQFIADPESVVPGNNMKPYSGLPSADARAKIVEFLKRCGLCGPSCPAPRMCGRP